MAGPLDIQRFPQGLLDLFGLKATGNAPHLLSEAIAAIADVLPLYLVDRTVDIYSGGITVSAAQQLWPTVGQAVCVVPPGEMWVVLNTSVNLSTGVGVSFTGASMAVLRASSTDPNAQHLTQVPQSLPASSALFFGQTFQPLSLILMPGDAAGIYLGTLAGGNAALRFQMRVAKIKL